MLTSKERAYLRGLANGLNAIFSVGKAGATMELVESVKEALAARELIKLHVLDACPLETKEAAQIIAERAHAELVAVIGGRFILYKKSKDKPMIEFPK